MRRQGIIPNAIGGAHAARSNAMCCVPNAAGGLCCANMSTREVTVARIWVTDEKSWKNKIRQTVKVR